MIKNIALVLLVIVWVMSTPASARGNIIDNALVHEKDGRITLEVELTIAFRYQSHFPAETGDELRITIKPVRVSASDVGAAFERDSLVPSNADSAAIDEVIYEGDAPGGPFLIVRFTRPVKFQFIQGSDQRSFSVAIQKIL
ncbi:hypothetical protein MNBD_GAMMA13-1819 [hydrothermal vent metagenome]|uniref:Uncharacterized protein n=1 Tax=hydrothermal vent metagenome TaxID=652676 RepID=A0A3B0YN73_9ZZZZ